MPTLQPVLLCGGSGTRLWPLSRRTYPKQFVPLVGDTTLFQAAALRMADADHAAPLIVTGADFRFIVAEQLAEVGVDPGAILIEPESRNTAPAILATALHVAADDPDAIMLVAPSDHVLPDAAGFRVAVESGLPVAEAGGLVTFGIEPTRPETGYGYLELPADAPRDGGPISPVRFIEKPDAETAKAMVANESVLWNSGLFLFSARALISAFEKHAAALVAPVRDAVEAARADLGFLRLDPEAWSRVPNISIDYAVMERADNLSAVPFRGAWSDLGGWEAVWRETAQDARGVATSGAVTVIDCDDTLLRSEDSEIELVGLGLKDIVAVAMSDAVLVADARRTQDVKDAVTALRRKSARQADHYPKDHRPWGWFETFAAGTRFQVRRIVVHPGKAQSLQSHSHRSEHWIVVEGTAKVIIGAETRMVEENQSIYVPAGSVHRLENPGSVPMMLIEVQTGAYLGEDDIVRIQDEYSSG